MRKISIADNSIRSIASEAALLFREKTAIAACLDSFGVDAVELPPIANPKEDAIINKTIASIVRNAALCVPVGLDEAAVQTAYNSIQSACKPCLQIEVPMSTVTMEYQYHLKAEKMPQRVAAVCKAAAEICETVELVAKDATRADRAFLLTVLKTACENGVSYVTLCDDAGVATPKDFEALVQAVKTVCEVPVYVQVSDALKMAAATALYAIAAGADGVKTSVSGKNELHTADLSTVLSAQKDTLQIFFNLKTTEIKSDIKELLKKVSRRDTTENTRPDNSVLLYSDSTVADVTAAAATLGYDLSPEDSGKVYKALSNILEKKPSIGAKELEVLIASSSLEVPSTYHLHSYHISSGNLTTSMSNIILLKDGEKLMGVATGDGPIDAAFFAIEQCIGYHYELDDFEIQSVTEGKEALGSAVVKLRSNGKLYAGSGVSADIVGASIRAYINALNKIVYEEGQA